MNGWLRLHRKIAEWQWYSCPATKAVFLHCLIRANWKECTWQGIRLARGAFFTSDDSLARENGLSRQQVRTALTRLKSTNEITIESTKRGKVITVCKFDTYNCDEDESNQRGNQRSNRQLTNEQPTANQQLTTDEEGKKNKKERRVEDEGASSPSPIAEFDPVLESDVLTSRGQYLEALAKRVGQTPEAIKGLMNGSPVGCIDAYLRNRAAEEWRTRGGRPIGFTNWFPDFEKFRDAYARNEQGDKPKSKPVPKPPKGWESIYAAIDPDPVYSDGEYCAPDWDRLSPMEREEVLKRTEVAA